MTSEQATAGVAADRLGAAIRALADVVVRAGAGEDELADAADGVAAIAARLAAAPPARHRYESPYHPFSLVGGTAHPSGPQLHTVPDGDGVAGTVVLGPAYEGGIDLVHGGIVSLMFDHAMGQAVFTAGHLAMTVSLEVRYLAPTPLETPLVVRARVERVEGRKVFTAAQLLAAGAVTAEGSGVFLELTPANLAAIFPLKR